MGFIYLITHVRTKEGYTGETVKTVEKRWAEHRTGARALIRSLAAGTKPPKLGSPLRYRAMARDGIANFKIERVVEVDDDDRFESEARYVDFFGTLAPGGYNMTSGGKGGSAHCPESRAKLSASRAAKIDDLRNPKLVGLPVRFTCRNYAKTGEQLILLKHPLCSSKTFSTSAFGSLEAAREAGLKFYAELEARLPPCPTPAPVPSLPAPRPTHQANGSPVAVYAVGGGYKYRWSIKGKLYTETFSSLKCSPEENKRSTVEALNVLLAAHGLPLVVPLRPNTTNQIDPDQGHVQRLNVGGSPPARDAREDS